MPTLKTLRSGAAPWKQAPCSDPVGVLTGDARRAVQAGSRPLPAAPAQEPQRPVLSRGQPSPGRGRGSANQEAPLGPRGPVTPALPREPPGAVRLCGRRSGPRPAQWPRPWGLPCPLRAKPRRDLVGESPRGVGSGKRDLRPQREGHLRGGKPSCSVPWPGSAEFPEGSGFSGIIGLEKGPSCPPAGVPRCGRGYGEKWGSSTARSRTSSALGGAGPGQGRPRAEPLAFSELRQPRGCHLSARDVLLLQTH